MYNYEKRRVEDLRAAIAASGVSAVYFAAIIEVNDRTVRRWLAGDQVIPGPAHALNMAIVRDPSLFDFLDGGLQGSRKRRK